MARGFLTSVNLNKNELQNAAIQNLTTAPSSPVSGQVYYNSTDKQLYQYNGTAWNKFTQSGAIVDGDIAANAAIATSKISNLASTVQGYSISSFSAPTGNLALAGYRITGLADPTAAQDATTKNYVDSAISGLKWKPSVNLLAISNVPLTGTSGTVTIDGHPTLTSAMSGYRILLIGQSNTPDYGIYVYTDNGSTYTLSRASDASTYSQLVGASVFVEEGTAYGTSSWVQTNTYLTSFSGQTWVQFSGAGQITAGTGLSKSGNTLSISTSYAGQTSIVTVGALTAGSLGTGFTQVGIAQGGTNATTISAARTNLSSSGFALPQKYTALNGSLVPTTGVITWTITAGTHGLGAIGSIIVQMKEVSSGNVVDADISINDTTGDVTLQWLSSTTITSNTYRVTLIG